MSRVLKNRFLQVLIAVAIPFVFAAVFGYGSRKNMYPWFTNLKRPSWSPPAWVFAPVWTYLYATMGYASFRVFDYFNRISEYSLDVGQSQFPLSIYGIQLLLNVTWPQVFFNLHLLGWSAIHILILLIFTYATGISFYRVDRIAGYLIIPYAIWGTYASAICVTTWFMNT
jgi:translocator protein